MTIRIAVGWALIAGCLAACTGRMQSGGSAARAPKPGTGVFFVAADGNDAWSGRIATANRGNTDGPFATLPRALAAARELKARQGNPRQAATIVVRGDTFFLSEPIVLTPEDSQISVLAYPGERPVVSGGRRITGWKETAVAGKKFLVAEIPKARDGRWSFRELWVNDRRTVRARHPNRGYLTVAQVPDAKPDLPWHQGQSRFEWKAGGLPSLMQPGDAEVMVMTRWVESRLPVAKVEMADRTFLFNKRSTYKLDPGDLWYAEGAWEFLDAPGEWFLDRREGRLYYAPLPGETASTVEVIAPVLQEILRLDGAPEAGRFVEDVIIRGIKFAHTEWKIPSDAKSAQETAMTWPAPVNEIGGFGQAAIGVPGAVRGYGVRNSRFENCGFVHLGSYGLELARGCQSNLVSRCEFADLGAGGIKIGETTIREAAADITRANEISDCHLYEGGRMYHSAIGVWIGQSPDNRILHNEIHDFYYTGISIGWTWGYDPRALATNNLVGFNHVHHIGVMSDGAGPILSDLGGIYTLGMQPGTRILNNLWHDIAGFRYGGWGIYFDEGSSSIVAESNVVYRTTHGGFHQHYGATNVVRNNIFAFARDHQLQRSREEGHVSFSFSNNIVLFDQGVLLGSTWKNDKFILDRNIYWDSRLAANPDETKFVGEPVAKWRARGHDQNSIIADPLIASPRENDYRLRPVSPAVNRGFHPIDLSRVGPRP